MAHHEMSIMEESPTEVWVHADLVDDVFGKGCVKALIDAQKTDKVFVGWDV